MVYARFLTRLERTFNTNAEREAFFSCPWKLFNPWSQGHPGTMGADGNPITFLTMLGSERLVD